MKDVETIEGELVLRGAQVAVLAARFNELVVERLVAGAVDTLVRHGADPADMRVVRVPGAWELPLAARRLAAAGRFDAVVALGAVIRGATPHFDHVAGQCAAGLARVALDADVPVSFGVLTCDTVEQALERAGTKSGNKGADAARAAIEMIDLLRRLGA